MGFGLGIIGGAMQGAGQAGMEIAKRGGDYLEKSTIQQEAADITKMRDARMQEFQAGESQKGREHATGLQERSFTHAETLQRGGFEHAEELQRQLKDFQEKQHGLDREQRLLLHGETMEQLKAQFKNQGLTFQSDKDGNMGVADLRSGSFTLLKGADGQPVKGQKADDAVKVMEALGHAFKSIDPMDTSPGAKELRERLGSAMLTTLNGKVAPQTAVPSETHIAALRAHAKDPKARAAFDKDFGAGAAEKILGAAPATPATPAASVADASTRSPTGAFGNAVGNAVPEVLRDPNAVIRRGLINRQLPPEEEMLAP